MVRPGYAAVTRAFRAGDVVTIDLPVVPRFVRADPRIDAVRGSVAVERGPVVYALESVDLPEGWDDVATALADTGRPPRDEAGRVVVDLARRTPPEAAWPYAGQQPEAADAPVAVPLVPYHDWAERGPSTMRIWIPAS